MHSKSNWDLKELQTKMNKQQWGKMRERVTHHPNGVRHVISACSYINTQEGA